MTIQFAPEPVQKAQTVSRRWIIPRLSLMFTAVDYADRSELAVPREALHRLIRLWRMGRLEVRHENGWATPGSAPRNFRPAETTYWRRAGRWTCVINFRDGEPTFGENQA